MRDEDRKMVEELRKIGGKPCLAMATFFEEAEENPAKVMEKAADFSKNLPQPITDLEGLLEVARGIARDLLADAAEKAARREALKTATTIETLIETSEQLLYEGDFAGARSGFADAVAKSEAAFGVESQKLIVPLMGLARAAGQSGGLAEELALQRRAIAIAEDSLGDDDMLRAECLHAHGVSTWASGDAFAAADLMARALVVVRRADVDPSPFLAPLIGALVDAKRTGEALPLARELLRLEGEGTSGKTDLTTLFVVGQALREAGAHAEARVVLQRFLDEYGDSGNAEIRAQVRGWLAELPIGKA